MNGKSNLSEGKRDGMSPAENIPYQMYNEVHPGAG